MESHVKCIACLFALVAAISVCLAQSKQPLAWPDLRNFSSRQLIACYNDRSICGTDNVYAISDELRHRLPRYHTGELVKCLADWKVCGVANDGSTGWAVSEEVARRGNPHKLMNRYWTEPDEDVRYGIVHVVDHFKTPEAIIFMKKVLAARRGDADYLYWPAAYLAESCDPDALKWLSTRKGRPEGCIVFTGTVRLFGKCNYRPAIPYLITYSLDDACLNIVDDAEYSLQKFYPDHPKEFVSLEAERKYYCGRALKEDFRVDCNIN